MILEVLNVTRSGVTASEVAGRTGLPASTVHRFLQNLCKLGYVAWEPEHKLYTVGFPLTLFGNRRLIIERIVNRQGHNFRYLVTMHRLDPILQLIEPAARALDQQQYLIRPPQLSLPDIARPDARQHIHTGGQLLAHDRLRDTLRLLFRLASHKDDNFVRHVVGMISL